MRGDPAARLQEELERLADAHGVPGAAAAIAVDGRTTEAATGVVSTRSGVPVTSDTLFMAQSVTKMLTASLVMQLVDDGVVGLEDPVQRHLPGFRTADAAASRALTVRHLLTHTGGFDGDLWTATTVGPDALERFVDDVVGRAGQHAAPGERFSYSNAGYGVLGRLVEVLRGLTYEEAVRRHLAAPLGIAELAFSADQALAFRTAIGHVPDPSGAAPRPLRSWAQMPPSNPAAGNQLAVSARGLLAFATMHLQDGAGPDGGTVLSPASARLMRARHVDHPAALGPRSSHGLGWWRSGDAVVEHGGGATGIASLLRVAPRDGVAAVVMTNGEGGDALARELLAPWFGPPDEPPQLPPSPLGPAGTPVPDPRRYLGRYEHRSARVEVTGHGEGGLRMTTTPQHEVLEMAARAGTEAPVRVADLVPLGGDVFVTDEVGREPRRVELGGHDDAGRADWLFDGGRAVPRVD